MAHFDHQQFTQLYVCIIWCYFNVYKMYPVHTHVIKREFVKLRTAISLVTRVLFVKRSVVKIVDKILFISRRFYRFRLYKSSHERTGNDA